MAASRKPRWGFALLGGLVVLLVAWWWISSHKPPPPPRTPTIPVAVAKVEVHDVPVSITALGAARAWQGVLIRAQVNGILKHLAPEGADVAAGALLAEIDSAPYRAVLTQAQGALARDRAQLAAARVDLARYQALAAQDSIAKQQVDTQAALVKADEGTVRIDEGSVAAAQVNVNYCRITSPLAGRVGVRLVDPGNLVSTSDTAGIVSVNQVSPIAVTFTAPEGDFQRLSDVSGGFKRRLVAEAFSQETNTSLGTGELVVADNHVDPATGTVQLKARFPNADRRMWPGQFVNVKLTLQTLQHALVIPTTAVNQGPKGTFAYVVGADRKAVMRPITVLTTQDAIAVIKAGLKPGETVVTDGQMTLKPGIKVAIHPANRPAGASRKPAA